MERDSHNKSLLFQNALHRILNRAHPCHLHHFPATTSIKRITMLSFNTHADKRFILRLLAILFLLLHLDSIWPFCGNRTQKKHTNTHSSLETSSTDCLAEVISAIQCFLFSMSSKLRLNIYFQFCDCFRLLPIQSPKMITSVASVYLFIIYLKCSKRFRLRVEETFPRWNKQSRWENCHRYDSRLKC